MLMSASTHPLPTILEHVVLQSGTSVPYEKVLGSYHPTDDPRGIVSSLPAPSKFCPPFHNLLTALHGSLGKHPVICDVIRPRCTRSQHGGESVTMFRNRCALDLLHFVRVPEARASNVENFSNKQPREKPPRFKK